MATETPRQDEPAGLPAGDDRPPTRRPVMQADVGDLLCCYREALELAADPPPSRNTPFQMTTRMLSRARAIWGLQRMVVEQIRRRIALIDRRYCLRLALGERDPNDDEDRAALAMFAASLPPPRSRLWIAAPVLALITVSQVLLALVTRGKDNTGTLVPGKIINELATIADLDPGHFTDTLSTLMHTSPKVTALAIGLLTFSAYIVWRPLVPAFRLKRVIFAMPGAISDRVARSELGVRARDIDVHRAEVELFAALGMRAPSDAAMDLWVKGALVAILVALAALTFVPPASPGTGAFLLVLAGVRLAWIARQWRGRVLRADLVTPHTGRAGAGTSAE